MRRVITIAAAACLLMPAGGFDAAAAERQNPFLAPYTTPFEIPPFEQITYADYIPALKQGIDEHNAEIAAVVANTEAPTFENTIIPLEYGGRTLDRVLSVLFSLTESMATPEMQAVEAEAMPLYSTHNDEVYMNDALFARVKAIYDNLDNLNLTGPQRRAVEEYYRNFVRNGALLSPEQKKELSELNTTLADLYLQFNRNLLAANNAFAIVVDNEADLAGLPDNVKGQAAEAAKTRGLDGKWVLTLHAPSRLPVLTYADNRDIRRRMYQGYTSQASEGEGSNIPVINNILKARARKAQLLGFKDFASYMTDNVMAHTPQAAEELLMKLWVPAAEKVKTEVAEMQAIADAEGAGLTIEPWDYYYYAEKVRKAKYDLDETEVSQYFPIDAVRNGIFTMANRLYGVTFKELPDAPKYHPECTVYEVLDADGNHLSVFMTDYFSRPIKRQGAWMDALDNSYVTTDGKAHRPIIYNVGNFSGPTADTPALLSMDDVETMFHEFGHGLHGMLSKAELPSQAGTNVDRDFVELPSQFHEHFRFDPALVYDYAKHYRTGETIPESLVAKINQASTHNQGFMTAELVGAALLDLAYGHLNPEGDVDVMAFEADYAKKIGMPKELTFRYRSPYFKHIFGSDGYASGYYTYLWAAVLDCDAFELFEQKGTFDPEAARAFKTNVLEAGGSEDPMVLYERFRGAKPTPDALLRSRGLK